MSLALALLLLAASPASTATPAPTATAAKGALEGTWTSGALTIRLTETDKDSYKVEATKGKINGFPGERWDIAGRDDDDADAVVGMWTDGSTNRIGEPVSWQIRVKLDPKKPDSIVTEWQGAKDDDYAHHRTWTRAK